MSFVAAARQSLTSTARASLRNASSTFRAGARRMNSSHAAYAPKSDKPWIIGSALIFGPAVSSTKRLRRSKQGLTPPKQFLYLLSPSARKNTGHVHNDAHDFPGHKKHAPEPVAKQTASEPEPEAETRSEPEPEPVAAEPEPVLMKDDEGTEANIADSLAASADDVPKADPVSQETAASEASEAPADEPKGPADLGETRKVATRLVDLSLENPTKYLPVLMERVQSDNFLSLHPRILDLLIRQLKPPPFPADFQPGHGIKSSYHQAHKDRINMALLGIQGLFVAVATDLEFAKMLLQSWSVIWPWMDFLYHFVPCPGRNDSIEPTQDELTALYFLERLLLAFFRPSYPVDREILSTKGVLKILAEMFIRQGVRPPNSTVLPKNHLASLSHALLSFLESPFSDKQELVDFLGSNNGHFARRMFYPVHQAAYGGAPWMECYPYVVDVHSSLFTHVTCVYESLPTKGIVRDVCHALSYFTSLLAPDSGTNVPKKESIAIECAAASLRLLVKHGLVAQDHIWIIQLLRFDFVLSLLKGARHWDTHGLENYYESLLREIAVYSVFPVVLKPVGQVLESKDILAPETRIPKDCRFFLVWTKWIQSMRNIQECKMEFILLGRYKRICGYPQRTLGFLHFLAEKVMRAHKSEIIRRRDEIISQLTAREPLALRIDLAEMGSPTVQLLSTLDQPPRFSPLPRVHSLLLPYIIIRYGKAHRQCPGDVNLAGELFGWFDRGETKQLEYK
ncbi:hypothetical protein C0995_015337 [Termitomyces sp. Mi166|nr:hypothetical protein C0995_015337 [Termitomyces sp. Mi166\